MFTDERSAAEESAWGEWRDWEAIREQWKSPPEGSHTGERAQRDDTPTPAPYLQRSKWVDVCVQQPRGAVPYVWAVEVWDPRGWMELPSNMFVVECTTCMKWMHDDGINRCIAHSL